MREDILTRLFYGLIDPWEDGPHDKEAGRKLNQEMAQLFTAIEEKVDDETKELLEKYLVRRSDMSMMLQCDSFKTGFRLGAKIMLVVCKEDAE